MEESKPKQPKHTPGPWEENSALAAAAPELLECLKEAVLTNYGCYGCTADGKHCFDKETFTCNQEESCPAKRWLAAIRKAEGLEGRRGVRKHREGGKPW